MDRLIRLIQNNALIALIIVIISVLSGIITIIPWCRRFQQDVLSKRITLPVYAYLIILIFIALVIIFWSTIKIHPKRLRTIKGESFGVQRIYVDGKLFVNCQFNGTELVFRGEAGVGFEGCTFKGIRLTLDGPAALTAFLFSKMYSEPGFQPFIDNTFEQIKSGEIIKANSPSSAAND